MELGTQILAPALKVAVEFAKNRLRARGESADSDKTLATALEDHISEGVKWSGKIQFFGQTTGLSTESSTIALNLHSEPRRFRGVVGSGSDRTERDLLRDDAHYLLLGDPGSGKTTTVKRLFRSVVLDESDSEHNIYRFPIVIRLRELRNQSQLITHIADSLAMPYVWRENRHMPDGTKEPFVGHRRLIDVLAQYLDELNALILLDGLDEISALGRGQCEEDVLALSMKLHQSKMIVSLRSGEFSRNYEGFNIVEICPLTMEQISMIAAKWLVRADDFLTKLRALPYLDVSNRPLLLSQLIVIYKRYGDIAEQPNQIYRKLLRLLLENWDAERGIVRHSNYASFDPDRKADFLAALAYHLTYRIKAVRFDRAELISVYLQIYQQFGLPRAEAEEVAIELETHTGIIVAAGTDAYEFSHLSLQEYLCANYIVRDAHPNHLQQYLRDYPAPVAVAVTLSSAPENWFSSLVLRAGNFEHLSLKTMAVLLNRLLLEKPAFSPSTALGITILKLFTVYEDQPHIRSAVVRLCELPSVTESIAEAMMFYVVLLPSRGTRSDTPGRADLILKRRCGMLNAYGFETPELAVMPYDLAVSVIGYREVHWEDNLGILHPLRADPVGTLTFMRTSPTGRSS